MEQTGEYIYGIINSDKNTVFGPYGITACEEVHSISYQDISAVVSDSEMVDYAHIPKEAAARLLVRHQKAIEKIMSLGYTVIPMRLGTFAVNTGEVEHILAKGYPIIKEIFSKISEKIEVDVAAIWNDFNSVLKEVGQEEEIKEFRERFAANPKGVTVDEQMKAGVMVKNHLDKRREECARQIEGVLKTVAQDLKAHELMDDKMVANFALLINRHKREHFDKKIEELNTKFNEKLNFRCVGPLPPYSFYTLEIKKMQFEQIDWARKKLGFKDDFATRNEIKKAHQRLAFSCHPDKNPNVPGIEEEFNEVTKAFEILQEFCQQDKCYFNKEEFEKNAVLVKVRT